MDFAKKQLEKYGWVEGKLFLLVCAFIHTYYNNHGETGQGLGREKNGVANPIKVKIKRDVGGVSDSPYCLIHV